MKAIAFMAAIPLRTPADIGALIRDRRRVLGLDQADLAGLIGVSRLWISQIERGKPGASLGLVLRALAAVGVDLSGVSDRDPDRLSPGAPGNPSDISAILANARRTDPR